MNSCIAPSRRQICNLKLSNNTGLSPVIPRSAMSFKIFDYKDGTKIIFLCGIFITLIHRFGHSKRVFLFDHVRRRRPRRTRSSSVVSRHASEETLISIFIIRNRRSSRARWHNRDSTMIRFIWKRMRTIYRAVWYVVRSIWSYNVLV